MIKLRPYQERIISDIGRAWGDGAQNVCAVLPTGAGKTIVFAHVVSQESGYCFAFAHRQELISQMSNAFAMFGTPHDVQAPEKLIRHIVRQQTSRFGRHYYRPGAKTIVGSVQTLVNRVDPLRTAFNSASLMVTDECFPGDTLVDGKPIRNYAVGDTVTAYDPDKKLWTREIVTRVFKNPAPKRMVRIDIRGRHALKCTPNHPILTRSGWKDAKDITVMDEVLLYESTLHNVRTGNGSSKILSEKTCCRNGKRLLLGKMQKEVPRAFVLGKDVKNKQKIRVGKNEKKKSDAQRQYTKKSFRNIETHWPQAENKGRKWAATNPGGNETVRNPVPYGFQEPSSGSNRGELWDKRHARPLQNRLWKSNVKNSSRGGRKQSLCSIKTGSGPKKRHLPTWERVGGISVYKRGDINGPYSGSVYNLEVSGPHTYLANGVVVHNCHHVLRENMWGKLISALPDTCRGLLVTATPERPDGKGIGRECHGIVDAMVTGPSARELIDAGFLSDYRIFGPYTDIDLTNVKISSATGDFVKKGLNAAVKKSSITGDIVGSYVRIAPGKIGVTFVPGVALGEEISAAFNAAGVPAAMVHAKTPDNVRQKAISELSNGILKQVVNVDLFGEGFDLPAIEVISMARPTASYVVYSQQFGRVLRIMEGKDKAIIIDHVKNVQRHGLPDGHREWSLDGRKGRTKKRTGEIPVRTCRQCTRVYQSWKTDCPYCGWKYVPDQAATIEIVEGDVQELPPDVLRALRGEVSRVDASAEDVGHRLRMAGAPQAAVYGAMARHRDRQKTQGALREAMAVWAGYQAAAGQSDSVIRKRFYATYGLDVLTAQTLGARKAEELTERLLEAIR